MLQVGGLINRWVINVDDCMHEGFPVVRFLCATLLLASATTDVRANNPRTLVVSAAEAKQLAELEGFSGSPSNETITVSTSPAFRATPTVVPASVRWTDEALNLIVKYQQNPLRAARVLSYVHASAYDALAIAKEAGFDEPLQRAAIHSAASAMLEYFYPQEPEGRLGAMGHAVMLTEAGRRPEKKEHAAAKWIGQKVAHRAKERAWQDGADRKWSIKNRPQGRPGLWQASPPLNVYRPTETTAKDWRTWLLRDGAELSAPPPVPYGTSEYWQEVREVWEVDLKLTTEQKKIADDWNLGLGTVTPAGVWNLKAREVALEKKLGTEETARLFAALNLVMIDAFIACWHVKFTHWTERPVTAIRAKYQSDFLPYLITPAFPSYVSGHSTVSAAAAEVLATFFPEEAAAYRTMAQEASLSRLYGGIHFRSDNERGLALGERIGRVAMERLKRN